MTTAELDKPVTWKTADDGLARVRILAAGPHVWQTQVELNGVGIPVSSVEYRAGTRGLAVVTLTFPAVVNLDLALTTGQVKYRRSHFSWLQEDLRDILWAIRDRIRK